MSASFASLLEQFENADDDTVLLDALDTDYRDAWQLGDLDDGYAVLRYIRLRRREEGFDLLIEGLRHSDADLAGHAAALVASLLRENLDLGPELRAALEELRLRGPVEDALGQQALFFLDHQAKPRRP